MQRLFNGLADQPGVTVKEFCSFCPNAKTGTLTIPIGNGENVDLPVCITCAGPELTAGIDHDKVDSPRKKVKSLYIGGGAVALVLIILLLVLIF